MCIAWKLVDSQPSVDWHVECQLSSINGVSIKGPSKLLIVTQPQMSLVPMIRQKYTLMKAAENTFQYKYTK